MFNYAVMNNNTVENVIIAETLEEANNVTQKECIQFTDTNPAAIGGTYDRTTSKFINIKPYDSWVLNESQEWEAPVSKPENGIYVWDEDTTSWQEVILDPSIVVE